MMAAMDKLSLTGLRVDCIVGVYPPERNTPQPLGLDLTLHLDTRPAAEDARLRDTVDYARLWGEIRFLLQASRFLLLESAAEAVARYILAPPTADAPRAQVQAASVRLSKPQALAGAGLPVLEIERSVGDFSVALEARPFGSVDVIFVTKGCSIRRLRLAPGACIDAHEHRRTDESELVLGDGLLLQGEPVAAGTARRWPHGYVHRYENPTAIEQSVLCVARPSFIADDHIPASPPPAGSWPELDVTCFFRV
jgi:dihydroneopterin aldolase